MWEELKGGGEGGMILTKAAMSDERRGVFAT